jgi:hypothetical protein
VFRDYFASKSSCCPAPASESAFKSEKRLSEKRPEPAKVPCAEPSHRLSRSSSAAARCNYFNAVEIQPRGRHMDAIGRKRWAIAEGYIPSESSFSHRALISHETACILNASDEDARVRITILFTDREPLGPYQVTVAARRTLHLRFNDLKDPAPVPRDTDYSSVFESNVPIVVQHTRLDSRHAEVSLLSTTAYAEA